MNKRLHGLTPKEMLLDVFSESPKKKKKKIQQISDFNLIDVKTMTNQISCFQIYGPT